MRILLLEDSVLDAELVSATLADGGIECEIVRVETRADFVAAIAGDSFDLILADYSLPAFDGMSALSIALEQCPEVPFIFVSGSIGEERAIESLKSGAVDYVLKDRLSRLVPAVRRALREAEERIERQRAQEALLQQAEELAQANRLKDEFLSMVSHELRTPLNSILGWTQMLRSGTMNEETKGRALDTIERNTKIQVKLVEDILDISRIIRGKFNLSPRPIDLVPIVNATLDALLPAAEARGIQVKSTLVSLGSKISGDPDRLQQVFWNLLSNAIKFTPEGGRVQIELDRVDSLARIRVSDTGKGISPEFLPYVFDRFRQADSSTTRKYGGLGLGLAIARYLVELHGGSISAESTGENQGATFTVELPLTIDGATAQLSKQAQSKESHRREISHPTLPAGLRVLVVDDDADTRELMAVVLKQYGARVRTAASVAEAIAAIATFQPEVMACDIGMPEEDGYGLIRQLRAIEGVRGDRIPALALTAFASAEDRVKALEAGFQIHLAKPIEPTELVAALGTLARGS